MFTVWNAPLNVTRFTEHCIIIADPTKLQHLLNIYLLNGLIMNPYIVQD